MATWCFWKDAGNFGIVGKIQKWEIWCIHISSNNWRNECSEEKKQKLGNYLNEIKYTILNLSEIAISIGQQIIELGILKEKSRDDSNHIGIAVANQLDYIISWNFKHMVNVKTVNGVRAITSLRNYKSIDLVEPTYFLEEE